MKAATPPRQHWCWRYSLRRRCYSHRAHRAYIGPQGLAAAEVPGGAPCPTELLALWAAGGDYGVCIDFGEPAPVRRWSDERKGAARRRRMTSRVRAATPMFADELIERALSERPDYFAGKST
jgi:hypothetical protein